MTVKKLAVIFLSWRFALFLLAVISPVVIPVFGNRFPYAEDLLISSGLPQWLWSSANFDGVHYLTIAQKGYVAEFTQAFFPLYPLFMGNIARLLFNQYILVGIIISTTAFFGAGYFLKQLVSLDYDRSTVFWTLLFLLLFPTSFYFGAVYTEGLFLFLVLASFYMARKQSWWLAGLFGAFACATRFAGIFLLPALALEYYLAYRGHLRSHLRPLLGLLLVPAGLFMYMIYLKQTFDDPFLFFNSLANFNTGRSESIILFPQVVWRYLKIFATVEPHSLLFFNAAYEFIITMAFAFLIIVSFFKTRLSYALFSGLVFLSPTLTGTFTSMPRYVLACFSAFIVIASVKNKAIKISLAVVSTILLIISTILFTQGYWVA